MSKKKTSTKAKKANIESIVGPQAFARLKEANLHTGKAIAGSTPEQVMSVAGIGTNKLTELYKFLGLAVNKSLIERKYRDLKDRTKFKRIKAAYQYVTDDPKKPIEKIENVRAQAIAWQNLLASVYNIGKKAEDRKQVLTYAPMSMTLDPFSIDSRAHPKDKIYSEVFIDPAKRGGKIKFEVKDLDDGELLLTEVEYFSTESSVQIATDINNILKDIYEKFRKKTLVGKMFIIINKEYEFLVTSLSEEFRTEMDSRNLFIIPGAEEYFSWEALFKYEGNVVFEKMVERFDGFHAYFMFDKYLKSGGNFDFDTWKADSEEYKKHKFWSYISDLGDQKSFMPLQLPGDSYVVYFGVIKGMPNSYQFKMQSEVVNMDVSFVRDTGYQGYVENKRELPINIGDEPVPAVVISLVHAVFDKFKVWQDKSKTKIIFQSEELPEIGIMYKKKGDK